MKVDRPSARYRLLIEELGREAGGSYGWKADAARRLGVDKSFVSRVLAGKRLAVSADVVARAASGLGIDERFFYVSAEPKSYRDFRVGPFAAIEALAAARSAALRELTRRAEEMTTEQLVEFLAVIEGPS